MIWCQTYSGVAFDLHNPKPEMVTIEDIAHHLANNGRFYGATRKFYSVAQHSVLATELVEESFKIQALMHDSPEAYVGDWSRPLKQLMMAYGVREQMDRIYNLIARVIGLRFAIDIVNLPPEVKHADNIMLATEKRDLMAPPPFTWAPLPTPRPEVIEPWEPERAELEFLRAWSILSKERAAMA